MTSQRCPACTKEGKKGRLRLKEDQDYGQTRSRGTMNKIWKCKKCGKEYIKVSRSWRRA